MKWCDPIAVSLLACLLCCSAGAAPPGQMFKKKGDEVFFTRPPLPPVPAAEPQALDLKDQLAVGDFSWALVRFRDASEAKVRWLTTIEMIEPSSLAQKESFRVLKGEVYFAGLERSREIQVLTPHGKINPKGTEFLVRVSEAQTEVIMYDGSAELENALGGVVVQGGEQGLAEAGKAPRSRAALESKKIVQWWLYYPGVLDVAELPFSPAQTALLDASLAAYRSGDLLEALRKFPGYPTPKDFGGQAERVYYAALLLGAGAVDQAEALLGPMDASSSQARALRMLVAAVTGTNVIDNPLPGTASEWLAYSYLKQSANKLASALAAARLAVQTSPNFGLGWERVAELEFSFGRLRAARAALDRALALSPRNAQAHALRGFILSAENHLDAARAAFDEAIRLDPGLANGWLGRGLVRIRQNHPEEGLADVQTAATAEPNRAFLHSYLGKAYSQASRWASPDKRRAMLKKAAQELAFARQSDPQDPTAWLYSALFERDQNRFNEAVSDLEQSARLNDNRQVYRSGFLLDQDRAVRSSSLAGVYEDAGLKEASLGEAAKAISADYANASAHMFLSDSYRLQRDPALVNLRYEAPWFAERLLAYLLGPIGSTPLSQNISQQEYSRLFEANRLGFSSFSEYRSDHQFREQASQFGTLGGTSYALDLDYRHNEGTRPNNELDRIEWYSALNQQLGPRDSLFLETRYQDLRSGDNFQYFDPLQARPHLSIQEFQHPWAVAGFHHAWAPGVHTLVLAGRLANEYQMRDLAVSRNIIGRNASNEIDSVNSANVDVNYRSQLEAYIGEFCQIFQTEAHTLILGMRAQHGEFKNTDLLAFSMTNLPPTSQAAKDDLDRLSGYAYYTIQPVRNLFLTAGIAYDKLVFPENLRQTPLSAGEIRREEINPKAALVWSPRPEITLRSAYARSLGGVSYDENFRLEPVQLAGFNQSSRSLISESVAGPVTGPLYETAGAALDVKLKTRTYLNLEVQWLTSDARRRKGVFESNANSIMPASLAQKLDYSERSASVALNQLIANEWSLGARYQFICSELRTLLPEVPVAVFGQADTSARADLHRVALRGQYQHSSGFFGRAEWDWYRQANSLRTYVGGNPVRSPLPGDSFAQANILFGLRLPRELGEITLGVLNVGGGDYHLNPLNAYSELPHKRVWLARLLLNF